MRFKFRGSSFYSRAPCFLLHRALGLSPRDAQPTQDHWQEHLIYNHGWSRVSLHSRAQCLGSSHRQFLHSWCFGQVLVKLQSRQQHPNPRADLVETGFASPITRQASRHCYRLPPGLCRVGGKTIQAWETAELPAKQVSDTRTRSFGFRSEKLMGKKKKKRGKSLSIPFAFGNVDLNSIFPMQLLAVETKKLNYWPTDMSVCWRITCISQDMV